MHIKLLQQPYFANPAASKVSPAHAYSSSNRSKRWRDSREVSLDGEAIRLMQAEALRLAAQAGQARIAADHAAEAERRALFTRAADAFDARARDFETLLEDA
jgi:hypothetical protein